MAAGSSARTGPRSPSRAETLYAFDRAVQRTLTAERGVLNTREGKNGNAKISVRYLWEALPALAGCDEAGRGALAGPVVVACVHFPALVSLQENSKRDLLECLTGLDDSKRLSGRTREALFEGITALARWGVGTATPAEIDLHGIVPACALAVRRAVFAMGKPVEALLLDRGLSLPQPEGQAGRLLQQLTFTQGDARSFHIAAASILAKVTRDRMMAALHARFPAYGFAQHKGYGTATHREALRRYGPSPLHRLTYRLPGEARETRCIDSQNSKDYTAWRFP